MEKVFRPKPQGKLNIRKVLEGMILGKKKIDIAKEAGSLATRDDSKIHSVNHVIKSNQYKKMSEKLIDKLDKEVERLIDSMLETPLDSVEYKDKSLSLERIKKLSELLKGGATDRLSVTPGEVSEFLDRA